MDYTHTDILIAIAAIRATVGSDNAVRHGYVIGLGDELAILPDHRPEGDFGVSYRIARLDVRRLPLGSDGRQALIALIVESAQDPLSDLPNFRAHAYRYQSIVKWSTDRSSGIDRFGRKWGFDDVKPYLIEEE